jgi:hypothetical protein
LIYPFCLTVGLGMISRTSEKASTKAFLELHPKTRHENCSAVRNNSKRNSMEGHNAIKIQLGILRGCIPSTHWKNEQSL